MGNRTWTRPSAGLGLKEHSHVDGEAYYVFLLMKILCRQKITTKDLFGIALLKHVERMVASVLPGLDLYRTKFGAFRNNKIGLVITVARLIFKNIVKKRIS